jgi:hypothetical protein
MSQERTLLTTHREVEGRLVPVGDSVTVPATASSPSRSPSAAITRWCYNGNMVRIDGTDADALGLEPITLQFKAPADGGISEEQALGSAAYGLRSGDPVDLVNLGLIYRLDVDQEAGRTWRWP